MTKNLRCGVEMLDIFCTIDSIRFIESSLLMGKNCVFGETHLSFPLGDSFQVFISKTVRSIVFGIHILFTRDTVMANAIVNIVMEVSSVLAEVFWYIGISGFALFFYYKYRQNIAVGKSMEQLALEEKLVTGEPFNEKEKEFMEGVFCSLRSKKDTINYFFIFASSLVALFIALYQDFFRLHIVCSFPCNIL